jgi:hypothetical protein
MHEQRRDTALFIVAAVLLAGLPARSSAASLYVVTTSDGVSARTAGYQSISDSFSSMSRESLVAHFQPTNPSFNPDFNPLSVHIGARGLTVNVEAATASSSLTMTIPSIGVTETFTGETRDDSLVAMGDWWRRNGGRYLGLLARKNAELSPVDPLAGNPNSAQAKTVDMSFDRGFLRLASRVSASASGGDTEQSTKKNANLASVGATYRAGLGTYGSNAFTLPLGYTYEFDDDPRRQLAFDLPISYESVEGARVYGLGAGIGYSQPVNDIWVLSGGIDYAIARSGDLGTNGHVITAALASLVTLRLKEGILMHVGNMVGHTDTLPSFGGDYACNPDIHDLAIKNGLLFYFATPGLLRSSGFEMLAMDTRYFGTKLYDSGYTEIGTSFGFSRVTVESGTRYENILRVGVSGIIARGNNGITVNTGYFF